MSTGRQQTVAIVDVYAPSVRLARAFADAGHKVIRVQSTVDVPRVYKPGLDESLLREVFDGNVIHDADVPATLDSLSEFSPDAVIAGGECGVELADLLSETLALPTNGTAHSEARRNKFNQVELLRAAGLRATRQILVESSEHVRSWHNALGGRAVIKPLRSAGNDGVQFCDDPEESMRAFEAIRDAKNIFSVRNEGVVAQEYLVGTEFVVNTVSCESQHRVTDVWRYTKMSANGVADRVSAAVSVPPDHSRYDALTAYAFAVLDALGIQFGPAHLEIMDTAEGPCLVEIGARISGADTAYYAMLAGGESQIEWTIDAYTDPMRFKARSQTPHEVHNHVAMVFLTSPRQGVLRGYPLLAHVEALESFHNQIQIVKPGQPIAVTISDTTEPMMIGLAHPAPSVLERDLLTVHYLDGHGFYDIEMGTA
ncbi:ATP-grasp domain-containing protein [Hoyosella altamirensis]|uniref:Biotin carboxylase n=1 Tax=Hoyosella altamirensis TaxID=616997 RepID=A0A839RRY3_9ACTN|nr:ATP-grasp domain-containing protein [Hoyosella altamirensis]MBB3039079.1 biotin carboxylase [Hoyosella altamirensis]